jgi:hypothetical protein
MDDNQTLMPSSPGSPTLFALFTTLHDDENDTSLGVETGALQSHTSHSLTSSLDSQHADHKSTMQQRRNTSYRVSKPKAPKTDIPGYTCFSALSGEPAKPPKRATFSKGRREQVKQVREIRACLRCKLRKITVRMISQVLCNALINE